MKNIYTPDEIYSHFVSKENMCIKFKNELINLLEDLIKRNGYSAKVSGRVKNSKSLQEKTRRKAYNSIIQVTDYIGLRVIVDKFNLIDNIVKIIKDGYLIGKVKNAIKYQIVKEECVDKSAELQEDKMGYRAVHLILRFDENEIRKIREEYASLKDIGIEVQIKTKLEDVWADTTHDVFYKSPISLNSDIKRTYNIMSAMLENIDKQFCELEDKQERLRELISKIVISYKKDSNVLEDDNRFDDSFNILDKMSLYYLMVSFLETDKIFYIEEDLMHSIEILKKMDITTVRQFLNIIDNIEKTHPTKSLRNVLVAYNLEKRTLSGIINNILTIYNIEIFYKIATSDDRKYSEESLAIYNEYGIDEKKLKEYLYEKDLKRDIKI